MEKWPIGVFASIDTGLGVKLNVAQELGVPTIQLYAPAQSTRTPDNAKQFLDRLGHLGITITAVFGCFEGESYADIPVTQRTVGLVPHDTRDARTQEMMEISDFAKLLDCQAVALHLGFIPHHDDDGPLYKEVVGVAQRLCDHCATNHQNLHLETGQESADGLLQFIHDVGRNSLFVNFDPANMIMYGTGEPIEALRKIGKHVRSVHCKDAKWAANPGKVFGEEVALGEGQVGIENYLRALDEIGYHGPLTIEREIASDPERQKEEIGSAIRLLNDLKSRIG